MNKMINLLNIMKNLKEELSREGIEPVYNVFLIKGMSSTVRSLNKTIRILNKKKQNSEKKEYIHKAIDAKKILMEYFDKVYNNEINSSKPQNYLNTLKKLKYYSELNLLLNLSPLEKVINDLEKDYPMLDVLKDGFMIKASEKILKNLRNTEIKNQILKNAYAHKAAEYLGIEVPDELTRQVLN